MKGSNTNANNTLRDCIHVHTYLLFIHYNMLLI